MSQSLLFIGTHTEGESRGIYRSRFCSDSGRLEAVELAAESRNSGWLAWHPTLPVLYGTGEIGWQPGRGPGSVVAWQCSADGQLAALNQVASGGNGPCHLSVHPAGGQLLVANYAAGTASICPLQADGQLQEPSQTVVHEGSGPNEKRQEKAHCHSINTDASGRFALVCDLGIDQVVVYEIDQAASALKEVSRADIPPGGGPRHLTLHPDGKHLFVNHELDGQISVAAFADGTVQFKQTLATLPADWSGLNTTAEVVVDADAKRLYVSNRGHDSLAVYDLDADAQMTFVGWIKVGGHPRHFCLDPSGKYLLVAARDDDAIQVFQLAEDGSLPAEPVQTMQVPQPICLRFER